MYQVKRYTRIHITEFTDYNVVEYWKMMKCKGLLKCRLAGIKNPSLRDIEDMIHDKNNLCFIMWDEKKRKVCADTMLNNFSGLTAQAHFSVHPDYHGREAINIAKEGIEQHFQLVHNVTGQRISTLLGLTPANNRLAIRFIKKVGFKIIDEIENLFYIDDKYVNGFASKLYVEDFYGQR